MSGPIVSAMYGYCLDIEDYNGEIQNARVFTSPCTDYFSQRWTYNKTDNSIRW